MTIIGFVIGWLIADRVIRWRQRGHIVTLRFPATKRQIQRAARANRADLRAVWPPPVAPPLDNFDHIDTRDMGEP